MKPIILMAAMTAWLLGGACGTDSGSGVNADRPARGKTVVSKQEASGRDGPRSRRPEALGVPLYPGATAAEAGRSAPAGAEDLAAQQGLVTSLFFSTDSIADIAAFYRKNLEAAKPRVYEMDLPSGRMVNIMLRWAGRDTNIVLSEPREEPGTLIRITRVVE